MATSRSRWIVTFLRSSLFFSSRSVLEASSSHSVLETSSLRSVFEHEGFGSHAPKPRTVVDVSSDSKDGGTATSSAVSSLLGWVSDLLESRSPLLEDEEKKKIKKFDAKPEKFDLPKRPGKRTTDNADEDAREVPDSRTEVVDVDESAATAHIIEDVDKGFSTSTSKEENAEDEDGRRRQTSEDASNSSSVEAAWTGNYGVDDHDSRIDRADDLAQDYKMTMSQGEADLGFISSGKEVPPRGRENYSYSPPWVGGVDDHDSATSSPLERVTGNVEKSDSENAPAGKEFKDAKEPSFAAKSWSRLQSLWNDWALSPSPSPPTASKTETESLEVDRTSSSASSLNDLEAYNGKEEKDGKGAVLNHDDTEYHEGDHHVGLGVLWENGLENEVKVSNFAIRESTRQQQQPRKSRLESLWDSSAQQQQPEKSRLESLSDSSAQQQPEKSRLESLWDSSSPTNEKQARDGKKSAGVLRSQSLWGSSEDVDDDTTARSEQVSAQKTRVQSLWNNIAVSDEPAADARKSSEPRPLKAEKHFAVLGTSRAESGFPESPESQSTVTEEAEASDINEKQDASSARQEQDTSSLLEISATLIKFRERMQKRIERERQERLAAIARRKLKRQKKIEEVTELEGLDPEWRERERVQRRSEKEKSIAEVKAHELRVLDETREHLRKKQIEKKNIARKLRGGTFHFPAHNYLGRHSRYGDSRYGGVQLKEDDPEKDNPQQQGDFFLLQDVNKKRNDVNFKRKSQTSNDVKKKASSTLELGGGSSSALLELGAIPFGRPQGPTFGGAQDSSFGGSEGPLFGGGAQGPPFGGGAQGSEYYGHGYGNMYPTDGDQVGPPLPYPNPDPYHGGGGGGGPAAPPPPSTYDAAYAGRGPGPPPRLISNAVFSEDRRLAAAAAESELHSQEVLTAESELSSQVTQQDEADAYKELTRNMRADRAEPPPPRMDTRSAKQRHYDDRFKINEDGLREIANQRKKQMVFLFIPIREFGFTNSI